MKIQTSIFKHTLLAVAGLGGLLGEMNASAQIGSYVLPRPVPLYVGALTNNQSLTNVFVGTNFLNYSGFHRPGLWATVTTSSTNGLSGSVSLNVDFSPGSGAGYTNSLLGTNLIYTTGAPFSWTIPLAGTNALVTFTNLEWPNSDSTVLFKGSKLSCTASNSQSLQIEIDAVVTP